MWFCMTSAETAVEVGYRDGYAVARKQYEADTRDLPPRSDTRFHEAYTAGFRAGYRQRQSENGPSTSWQRFWKEMPQL